MSFLEQAKKRKACDKLSSFLKLMDLILGHTVFKIVTNSLRAIDEEMNLRIIDQETATESGMVPYVGVNTPCAGSFAILFI